MRKLKLVGAVLAIVASFTVGAHAADKPPCSGDAKARPDDDTEGKEKKRAPKADAEAPSEDAPEKGSKKKDAKNEDDAEPKTPDEDGPKAEAPNDEAPKEKTPKDEAPKDEGKDEPDGGQKRAEDNPADDGAEKKPPPPEDKPAAVAPKVSLNEPKLVGGEVKLVTKMLQKTFGKVAACVKESDGLDGKTGFVELQFLVRVRGRAEGVEVRKQKGVSKPAAKCVQKLLKNLWVGTPSNDPVGVTFRYELKAP